MSEPAASGRGEQTRQAILDAALALFAERGYDRTTMRAVASAAGVSVGNAYYYFGSKEHLIQGYYDQIQQQHARAAAEIVRGGGDLGERLAAVLHAWIEVAEPYRGFASQLIRTAADPRSPLSPFSPESASARDGATDLMRAVVDGSGASVDARLRPALPHLLWLLEMGLVLFWVYDRSPDARRSHELVDGVAPLVARLVRLSRLPVLRGTVRELLDVMGRLGLPTERTVGSPDPEPGRDDARRDG